MNLRATVEAGEVVVFVKARIDLCIELGYSKKVATKLSISVRRPPEIYLELAVERIGRSWIREPRFVDGRRQQAELKISELGGPNAARELVAAFHDGATSREPELDLDRSL